MCPWTARREMQAVLPFRFAVRPSDSGMPLSTTTRALALAVTAALATCNVKTPTFSTVTFERTPCFGTCPVYRVNVNGNGEVKFEGIRNVDSVGTFVGHIDAS